MLTLAAILAAVLFVPSPWGAALVAAAALADIAETVLVLRWSRRRRSAVGTEALVGRVGVVTVRLAPTGRVRLDGELWAARGDAGTEVEPGTDVVVAGVEGLVLVVRPQPLA